MEATTSDPRALIRRVARRGDLREDQAYAAAVAILRGRLTSVEIAALLLGLHMKGETEAEIAVAAMVEEKEGFQEELDKVQDEVSELAQIEATVVGSSAVVTTGLSVGYVVWLARGGLLIASLLSSMPAWRAIDPLPVLASFRDSDDEEDDESLDTLVSKGGANKDAKPARKAATQGSAEPDIPLDDGATT